MCFYEMLKTERVEVILKEEKGEVRANNTLLSVL